MVVGTFRIFVTNWCHFGFGPVAITVSLSLKSSHSLVQSLGHFRAVHVIFAAPAVLHEAEVFQLFQNQFWESLTVERHYLVSQFRDTQTADPRNRAFETQIEQIA